MAARGRRSELGPGPTTDRPSSLQSPLLAQAKPTPRTASHSHQYILRTPPETRPQRSNSRVPTQSPSQKAKPYQPADPGSVRTTAKGSGYRKNWQPQEATLSYQAPTDPSEAVMASGTRPRWQANTTTSQAEKLQPETSTHEEIPGGKRRKYTPPRPCCVTRRSILLLAREGQKIICSGAPSASYKSRLHLGHFGDDRHAGAFVQDLDAVDLHRGGGAQLRGSGQGDVEGQDLIGVPGLGELLQAVDSGHGLSRSGR